MKSFFGKHKNIQQTEAKKEVFSSLDRTSSDEDKVTEFDYNEKLEQDAKKEAFQQIELIYQEELKKYKKGEYEKFPGIAYLIENKLINRQLIETNWPVLIKNSVESVSLRHQLNEAGIIKLKESIGIEVKPKEKNLNALESRLANLKAQSQFKKSK